MSVVGWELCVDMEGVVSVVGWELCVDMEGVGLVVRVVGAVWGV